MMQHYIWELVPNVERYDIHISMDFSVRINFIINMSVAERIYNHHSFPVLDVLMLVQHFFGTELVHATNW